MKKHSSPNRQSGAVLYVALVMLVLLALIGIVAMQVAGLQERMSANYQLTSNFNVRAGIINLTDKQPSYPTISYGDILGRRFFAGATFKY